MNNFQSANEHIIFDHDFNVTFTARRLTLSSVLTNSDLGELPNNDSQTIINRLMDLNPELQRLSRTRFISVYINNRFITHNRMSWPVIEMSDWLRNEEHIIADSDINVTFTARKLTLSSVITNTDLGELSDSRDETILERIVQLNPGIDINDIFRTGIGELENGEIRAGIFHTRDRYADDAIFVYFRIAKDNNKQKDSSHIFQLSGTTTTTPSPSAGDGSAVSPSTSGQSSNTGNSAKNRNQHNNQGTNSNRRSQKPKCDVLQKQIIEQKLLDIYHTTSANTKNNARKKLQDIYGKHFTDTSWEQFEKFVELHKYGMVFVTPNNNEYLVATGTVTGVSVPVGYVLMKAAVSQAETTSSVGTLAGEESIPLLDIGEGGAWLVGEEAVAEGAVVMVEGGAVLGPVGLVIGAGVVIVGGIAYIYYNWSHAHNADINSHNQYNQIEKY